jgi:putative flavoprotein involved in K+ transport
MPLQEIVERFEQYEQRCQLPVRHNTRVTTIEQRPGRRGYRVAAGAEAYEAENVVVATGSFQAPKKPPFSTRISPKILQLHTGEYRNPEQLPPGAVLVVGSGQSGCQIAEELYQSGRTVYLCVGTCGRAPRRYRGKDIFAWLELTGFISASVESLPSPRVKFAGNPQVSGKDGGHTLNVHQFCRDGVRLLGRLQDAEGLQIRLAPDLKENLAKSDQFEVDLVKMVDGYIAKNGLDAPAESLPQLREGYAVEVIEQLNLAAAGVSTLIWAQGYVYTPSLVKLPVTDADGYPLQKRGVSAYPGLYFVGQHFLATRKSAILMGVGEDAAYIATKIDANGG